MKATAQGWLWWFLLLPSFGLPLLQKDGSLEGLAELLNQRASHILWGDGRISGSVDRVDRVALGPRLLEAVGDWVTAEPAVALKLPRDEELAPVNCAAPLFAGVLTGAMLSEPRPIVDFVPFGVDVDALEIRLAETWSAVDLFVIYESPRTFQATPKPLFFDRVKDTPRFARWADKIVHIAASEQDIARFTQARLAFRRSRDTKAAWALDKSSRTEMVRRFAELLQTNATLRNRFALSSAWATQNDGDELVSREALMHVKHCELRPGRSIFFPSLSFKKNFHWLQLDRQVCLRGGGFHNGTSELLSFMWSKGPYLWPLQTILGSQSTLRGKDPLPCGAGHRCNPEGDPCDRHMGLGAATHLSSVAEPAQYWYKRWGMVEQSPVGVFPVAMVQALLNRSVSPTLLLRHAIVPWCKRGHAGVHADSLVPAAREALEASIPRVVRQNPDRYPFLLPGRITDPRNRPVAAVAVDPRWSDLCSQPGALAHFGPPPPHVTQRHGGGRRGRGP